MQRPNSTPSGSRAGAIAALAIVILVLPGGMRAALAISGESAASVGTFVAPAATCQTLRTKTGVQGDVVFACDPAGEACEIALAGSGRETLSGIAAVGFCDDSFPAQGFASAPPGVIKEDVIIEGSSFLSLTGVKAPGNALNEAENVICSTSTLPSTFTVGSGANARVYGPGVRVCRKIVPCGGSCPTTPPNCSSEQVSNYFVTVVDTSATGDGNPCADVQALVTGTITQSAPSLAFALFSDINTTPGSVSQPGRHALLVCPGYKALCVDGTNRAQQGKVVDYHLPIGAVQEDPDCYTTSKGYRTPKPPCR